MISGGTEREHWQKKGKVNHWLHYECLVMRKIPSSLLSNFFSRSASAQWS